MLKTAIERARFQDNVGSCCVRLHVAKSLTAFKLSCATTRNNGQQHPTKLRPFAPGFKQPQRQRQKKLHLHWKASSCCFKLYRLQASSPIWAREASWREPSEGPRKGALLSLPRPPLSRLLSRASRVSTFQDVPQMESLLAGYKLYYSCSISYNLFKVEEFFWS